MSAETQLPGVLPVLQRAVQDRVIPGFALTVRSTDRVLLQATGGMAELRPRTRPVRPDQPWDLASLTKVLATTPLALSFVAQGALDLDAPLAELLPGAPAGVTARHCLEHSSGLPAWRPLVSVADAAPGAWGTAGTRAAVLDAVLQTPVEAPPGQRHCYSDLGFLLLGAALEQLGGDRLDRLWETRVRAPSGLDLRWGWPGAAATEDCPVRKRVLVGEVHDLNAAVMGGIAAHAGLFGSADAVAAFAAWQLRGWRGEADLGLDPATLQAAWSHVGPGSHHLGWDGVSPRGSSASERWPRDGVGHLGFTGCSLWLAPRHDVVVALCTNRVHPDIEGGAVPGGPLGPRTRAFRVLRPALHRAVVQAIAAGGGWSE